MWRFALILYKGVLLSVLHVSSSRNNGTKCHLFLSAIVSLNH